MQRLGRNLYGLVCWSILVIFLACILIPIMLHGLFYFYKAREGQWLYFAVGLFILAGGGYALLRENERQEDVRLKALLIVLFVIGGIARVWAVLNSQPEVDAEYCLQSAMRAVNGDFGWAKDTYFLQWGYQIPLVLLEAAILRIFGSVFAIHMINVFASLMTGWCLYRISDELVDNRRIAIGISGMFLLMPSNIIRLGNPYNQTISAMFAMIGVLLWIKGKNIQKQGRLQLMHMFGAGIALGAGKLFRSDGVILLIAIICWNMLNGLSNLTKGNKRALKTNVVGILVLVLAYCLIVRVVDLAVIAAGINDFGIDNNCPYWAIVCGLTPDNFGSYHIRFSWIGSILEKEAQKTAFFQILREIFEEMDLLSWIWFYFNKIYNMWVVEEWYFGGIKGILLEAAKAFEKSVYFIVMNMGLVTGFAQVFECRKKQVVTATSGWFFMIAYIGFFLIYLFVESVVRYRYLAITTMFVLAAKGMQDVELGIRKYRNIRKKSKTTV